MLWQIQYWGLLVLLFLIPVFFLPFTQDFFDFNKIALLAVGTLLLALVWAIRGALNSRFSLFSTPFDLPVLLVALSFLVSSITNGLNNFDNFFNSGSFSTFTILALTFFYFMVVQTVSAGSSGASKACFLSLIISGLLIALAILAGEAGVLEKIDGLPEFMKSRVFSPAGSSFSAAWVLGLLIALIFSWFVFDIRKQGKKILSFAFIACLGILFAALVVAIISMLPGKPGALKILPFAQGWTIAVETLKQSPFGVGPSGFVSAFNQFRSVSYNETDLWNLRFISSSNLYLHVFTVTGIAGLGAFLFLVWKIVHSGMKVLLYPSLFVIILFLFLPATFPALFLFYAFLGIAGAIASREVRLVIISDESNVFRGVRILPLFIASLVVIVLGVVGVKGGYAYAAEVNYKQALDAASRDDGKVMYDGLVRAINQNPNIDRYRITFSQANLIWANNLAKKEDVTETERKRVSEFVQQAIAHGRAAVALNNKLSTNWENLGVVYRAVMPLARDADQFAIASYAQAIALEPANPMLRLNLGNIHYGAGRYDEAVRSLEFAVLAKPDFANAHYNLAAALREKGDISRAIKEIETVLQLVSPDTQDYETAQKELENLKSKLPSQQASASGETLQAPSPSPKPVLNPQLDLPEEAAPPASTSREPGLPGSTTAE